MARASLSMEAREICNSGVLTPDHVIRTKNLAVYVKSIPESDDDLRRIITETVSNYRDGYDQYFRAQVKVKRVNQEELDSYPRIFLVAGIGLMALGFTRKAARIAADIAEHTIKAKLLAKALGDYVPISDSHVFDMEYWSLQQKKLGKTSPLPLQGHMAIVTGGAGAMGYGIADRLLAAGAVVMISDIDEPRLKKVHSMLASRYDESQIEALIIDVTDYKSVENAFREISLRVGGLDIVVPNAGVAHVAKIEDLDPQKFDQVIAVNLKGTFNVIKASIPIFKETRDRRKYHCD